MFRAAIVEDSDSDRELLESYLEKSGGFIVSKFSSAVDFLRVTSLCTTSFLWT